MDIEKFECTRLGYEYSDLLEQVVSVLHHIPYAKDYISEEALDKLHELAIKIVTGDCEIIEFKRNLCRYNLTEKIDEQDKQIQELTNNWRMLEEFIQKELDNNVDDIKSFSGYQCKIILDKMKEIKGDKN